MQTLKCEKSNLFAATAAALSVLLALTAGAVWPENGAKPASFAAVSAPETHGSVRPYRDIYSTETTISVIENRPEPVARKQNTSRSKPSVKPVKPVRVAGNRRTVSSTAYCLTGTMANGQRASWGYAAMNGVPLGSRWRVVETSAVYVIGDRIGHGSQFDIAFPGNCAAARAYGRRTITIERIQ